MRQQFIIIGISDNPVPDFDSELLDIIHKRMVFSGGERHWTIVRKCLPEGSEWISIRPPLKEVFEQYRLFPKVVIFASGDPLFFGFANTIRAKFPDADIIVYPTFNSLQMLAHRLAIPYHDMRIVSLTGRPWHEFDRVLIERAFKIGVLTDREHTPAVIAGRMLDYGYDNYHIYIGEHLGNPQKERVLKMSLRQAWSETFEYPNCIILEVGKDWKPKYFGIPDELFAGLDNRPGMITKAPVRLLTLSMLSLARKNFFWDIGFCTGSVSIEAKLQFPHLRVTAFEVRPEGKALMRENSRKLGAPGITAVNEDFMEADISLYPRPDAVFIGGHGGRLKEMFRRIREVLAPGGVIVFNAVSEESRQAFTKAAEENGFMLEASMRVAIDKYNPIEIMKARVNE